jgi:Zn-dependent protease
MSLQDIILINIGLGIFNLIPLPPLDGSKILAHFLPYNAKQWFYNNEQIFYIIFLVLAVSGLASVILAPISNLILSGMYWVIDSVFKLFM